MAFSSELLVSPVMLGVSCIRLISVFVFTWPSLCVCVSPNFSCLRTPISHTGLQYDFLSAKLITVFPNKITIGVVGH